MNNQTGIGVRPVGSGTGRAEHQKLASKSGGSLGFGDLVKVLRKRLLLIAVCAATAVFAAAYMLWTATPRYYASAEILLGPQIGVDRSSSDLLEARALSDSSIQGELAVMQSSALLVRVVRKLGLDADPEFNAALRPPDEPIPWVETTKSFIKGILLPVRATTTPTVSDGSFDGALESASAAQSTLLGDHGATVGQLRRNISVRQLGRSFVVVVSVGSESPVKAAGIVNTVADEYIDYVSDKRFEAAQRFTGWLEMRVEELAQAVEESETAVIAFKASSNGAIGTSDRIEQQMQEMTTKLVNTRTQIDEAVAAVNKARELYEAGDMLTAAGVLSSDALKDYAVQAAALRRSEAQAVTRFSDDSTQVAAIRRDIAALTEEMGNEVQRSIRELENRAEVLRINAGALSDGLARFEDIIRARSKETIKLNQLERIADANRRLYEDFLGRYKEASEIQNLRRADAEVISYSSPPGAPATPRKKPTLVLATVTGLFIGIGIALLLEMLPKRFASSSQVTRETELKVFGILPLLPSRKSSAALARHLRRNPKGTLATAASNMVRNLEMTARHPLRSVMICSNENDDAKTTLAMLFAWVAARQGLSCVIVDADIQNGGLGPRFGIKSGPRLLDVLYDNVPLLAAIRKDPKLGVSVLATQTTNIDPFTLFGTKRASVLISELKEHFDMVVMVAPPLGSSLAESNGFETIDAGLYLIEANRTRVKPVVEQMGIFGALNVDVAGAVLTGAKTRDRPFMPNTVIRPKDTDTAPTKPLKTLEFVR